MMTEKIQVVIVDDHPIVRAGMRAILEAAGLPFAALSGKGVHLREKRHP